MSRKSKLRRFAMALAERVYIQHQLLQARAERLTMPPVYVIHCPEFADRSKQCFDHLRERMVNAIPWRSIHGKSWGLQTDLEYEPGYRISPGHIGLILGHWTLWNHLSHTLDLIHDYAIVLEDDVEIPVGFWHKQDHALNILTRYNPDWQFAYLGLAEKEPQVWGKVTERIGGQDSPLCRIDHPFGTHAYMVRREALPILLDRMAHAQRNIDQQLYRNVWEPKALNWCAFLPSIIRQKTYDYEGKGRPEWDASTLDEKDLPYGPNPLSAAYPAWKQLQEMNKKAGYIIGVDLAIPDAARTVGYNPNTVGMIAPARAPEPQSKEAQEATLALTDPYPCIYRGEYLEEHGQGKRRTIPLIQCALFNEACHQAAKERDGVVTTLVDSWDSTPGKVVRNVRSCEDCGERLAVKYRQGGDRLPLPDGHFNPSLAWHGGRLILSTRDNWGHSKVALWELRNTKPDHSGEWSAFPIASFSSDHPEAPRLEDSRLFNHHSYLCSMFNLPDKYPPKVVRVGWSTFKDGLRQMPGMTIYPSPNGNAYEKNWAPFIDRGDKLRWIYSTKPTHSVMRYGGAIQAETFHTPNPLPWTGGVIRGGAAPVRIGEELYHFFHGCLKGPRGNVYTVGCAVFESTPPFRVLRQTTTPLIWPDLPALGESVVKRYVVWPGGAVLDYGDRAGKLRPYWLLALGIDDTYCRIVKLDFRWVEDRLNDKPETARVTSIRDTEVAHGVKLPE